MKYRMEVKPGAKTTFKLKGRMYRIPRYVLDGWTAAVIQKVQNHNRKLGAS